MDKHLKSRGNSKKLRASARGRMCTLNFPGVCNSNPETTVLCHLTVWGYETVGGKAPDICGCFGCSACHDVVDGRRELPMEMTPSDLQLTLRQANAKTLLYWLAQGLIIIEGNPYKRP